MEFSYSDHALNMIIERDIDRAWVEAAVRAPDFTEPDPIHPDRIRAFRALPERDGRVLRMVHSNLMGQVRIITVFLDRGQRRRR